MVGLSNRFLLAAGLVVVGVGALDALVGREWDLLLVFALAFVLLLVPWIRQRANRIPVGLRPDLARWLEHRSERTGEPFDDLLDRSVAWYRDGLFRDRTGD
jgi:hypothetical protein